MKKPSFVVRAGVALVVHASLWISSQTLFAQDSLRQRVDRLVQPYLDQHIVAGMTIGILDHGQQEIYGFGRAQDTGDEAPGGDTVYEIGSMSKVFTGLLLADAVVQGHVKLDQPAADLLPPGVKMPSRGERPITLVDLATHVSGLPRLPDNLKPQDAHNPYADYTVENLYAFLNGHALSRAAGEQGEYSNLGMGLLGHLLALRQHATYEQLLHDRIALPLGMTSTSIALDQDQQARLASPHYADGHAASNWDLPTLAGAGAIRSTANDLLRFAQANLEPPPGDLGRAIELAWKIHQKPLAPNPFAMGLGWHVARDGTTHWHNGQTGGYHSMIFVSREHQSSVVLLSNTGTTEVDPLAEDIVRLLAGAKVEPRKFDKLVEVSAEAMQKLAGKYELAPGAVLTVSVQEGKLMAGLTGQPTVQVFARSETEWFYKVVQATLTFKLDEQGKCQAVVISQFGIRKEAQRVE